MAFADSRLICRAVFSRKSFLQLSFDCGYLIGPEFVTWGRLGKDGRPYKEHTGETFRSFVYQLRKKGYDVDWRELKACDYGARFVTVRTLQCSM